ncbi:MAG: sigma-70 region 4 domain-containing protein [Terriglobales bacterium]
MVPLNADIVRRAQEGDADAFAALFHALLHEVDGYEHQEIADLLECSAGNSKSQLYKARKQIRQFPSGPGIVQAEQSAPTSCPGPAFGRSATA